jgi:hypothetical protein
MPITTYLPLGLLVVVLFALSSHHQVLPQAALVVAAVPVAAVLVLDAVF